MDRAGSPGVIMWLATAIMAEVTIGLWIWENVL